MDLKNLIRKIIKAKVTLSPEEKKYVGYLIRDLKQTPTSEIVSYLLNFKDTQEISDEHFGEIMNRLIDAQVFLENGNPNPLRIKELKKITNQPPIKIYFNRTF